MQDRLHRLLDMVLAKQATDIHFTVYGSVLQVKVRGMMGMEEIHSAALDVGLFHYLKYIADLDLGNSDKPQSGRLSVKAWWKAVIFSFFTAYFTWHAKWCSAYFESSLPDCIGAIKSRS